MTLQCGQQEGTPVGWEVAQETLFIYYPGRTAADGAADDLAAALVAKGKAEVRRRTTCPVFKCRHGGCPGLYTDRRDYPPGEELSRPVAGDIQIPKGSGRPGQGREKRLSARPQIRAGMFLVTIIEDRLGLKMGLWTDEHRQERHRRREVNASVACAISGQSARLVSSLWCFRLP